MKKLPLIPFYFANGRYINLVKGITVKNTNSINSTNPAMWEFILNETFRKLHDPDNKFKWSKGTVYLADIQLILKNLGIANWKNILTVHDADTSWMTFKQTRVEVRMPTMVTTVRVTFNYGGSLSTRSAAIQSAFRTRNLLKLLSKKCSAVELISIAQTISDNPDHLRMFN